MGIETYQTPEARKLLDEIGWPEWAGKGVMYALNPVGDTFWRTMPGRQHNALMNIISDHEALCILRDHLREWLDEHGPWTMHCDDYDTGLIEEAEAVLDREIA